MDVCVGVTGGYDRGECLSSVESFNLAGNGWSPMKPMSVARGRFAATMLSGKLYACGGSNGTMELKSAECYDPSTEAWSQLPDMTSQRTSAGLLFLVDVEGEVKLVDITVVSTAQSVWLSLSSIYRLPCRL